MIFRRKIQKRQWIDYDDVEVEGGDEGDDDGDSDEADANKEISIGDDYEVTAIKTAPRKTVQGMLLNFNLTSSKLMKEVYLSARC